MGDTKRPGSGEMVAIPSGEFLQGAGARYPEEGPPARVSVDGFVIDRFPVTNQRFSRFVAETGYETTAERPVPLPGKREGEGVWTEPGSLVFTPTRGPVPLTDWRRWWRWVPGASWRHPAGPGSDLSGREDHPVVQVSYADAGAFAAWEGKRLATELEWEFAARGGIDGATYSWGEASNRGGVYANTWQGRFPYENRGAGQGRWVGTSPVGSFPQNGYGLSDMTGNVWEWTTSPWVAAPTGSGDAVAASCGCAARREAASAEVASERSRVLKGGSHLCAPEYCLRYRPAARSEQTEDSATSHIGFRCVADAMVWS